MRSSSPTSLSAPPVEVYNLYCRSSEQFCQRCVNIRTERHLPPPSPFTLCQLIKSLLVKKFRFEETPLKLWTIIRDAGLAHFLRIGLPNCCTTTPLHWKSSEPPGYVCNIIFCISMWTSRNLTPQLVTTLELRHGCVAHPFFTRTSDMN